MTNQGLPSLNHLLQQTLRSLCTNSQWMYAVFWRIRPRNYPPPQWETEGGFPDRSKGNKRNWNLVWEDGFCNFSVCSSGAASKVDAATGSPFLRQLQFGSNGDSEGEASFSPELFFKMSHEVYSYGEGLMGKVAADNSHKWVYREPQQQGISLLSPWHGSLDPHPRTWEGQFKAGIQTIALVAVEEGLLQLGSTSKILEDLNFVILLQRKFNYLQSIPGVFVSHPTPMNSGIKRRAYHQAEEESPPSESGNWIMSPDFHHTRFLSNGFSPTAIDQFLSSRLGMNGSRYAAHDSASILGIKRPPDMDTPGLAFDFDDYPGYSSSGKLLLSGSYASRHECPFPPKALNTGTQLSGNSSNLLPSMSSLQALLSKLPSVTEPKELAASNHAGLQGQLADSPPAPQLHATTSSPSPTSTNYGSPPALANPMPQAANKNSPIKSPTGAVQVRMSSSPHHDRHRSSSPDQNPHEGADQSDSTPITSAAVAASDALSTPPGASNQSWVTSSNQMSGNYNGSSAQELHPVTVSEKSDNNNNIAPGNLASNNSCTANAAATSGTPMQLSDSVIRDANQRNNFQHQQQLVGAAAAAADVSNNLRRHAVASLYHSRPDQRAPRFKDKLMTSSCTATSLDQATFVDNQLQQQQDHSYFSFQDALENSKIYDSIFSEI